MLINLAIAASETAAVQQTKPKHRPHCCFSSCRTPFDLIELLCVFGLEGSRGLNLLIFTTFADLTVSVVGPVQAVWSDGVGRSHKLNGGPLLEELSSLCTAMQHFPLFLWSEVKCCAAHTQTHTL